MRGMSLENSHCTRVKFQRYFILFKLYQIAKYFNWKEQILISRKQEEGVDWEIQPTFYLSSC